MKVKVDSRLVANQVNEEYEANEEIMSLYKEEVKKIMTTFNSCLIEQVSRTKNKVADTLSKLASIAIGHSKRKVLVETQAQRSI